MGFLDDVKARAKAVGGRVVFAEGDDPRIVEAARRLVSDRVCHVSVVCPHAARGPEHRELAALGVEVLDPATDSRREALAEH